MSTFTLDATNDLILVASGTAGLKKNLNLEADAFIAGAYKLRNRFQFFLGEWFLDTRLGIPYFQLVFVKNPDLSVIKRLFTKVILSVPIIATLKAISVTFDRAARELSFSFDAQSANGRKISGGMGTPFIVDGKDLSAAPATANTNGAP